MKKLKLMRNPWKGSGGVQYIAFYREAPPFVLNNWGKLVHRPKWATQIRNRGMHIAVHYYCDNGATGDCSKIEFTDNPPEEALLCVRCELNAVAAGLPSASSLVGRHIHVGKLRAERVCCVEGE